ncbi:MAG: transporter [Verrucomicrobiota bacterium]
MKTTQKISLVGMLTFLAVEGTLAGEMEPSFEGPRIDANDKSQYHLLNPTPRELMRELSPDRPDATESPLTVDAGHFAFEVSLFDWRRDGGDDAYTVMAMNFKVGLTNRADLQFVFDAYSWEDPESGGGEEGFGDVQLRLKYNLWGNDGGNSALALFPFVKIPTGTSLSNDEWEGGLIVPFSTGLTERVGLGLMAEFDAVYDDEKGDHDFEFLHTAVIGVDLTDRLGTFVEYVGITGDTPYQAYAAGGFTFAVSGDLVLDCGAQAGLNDAAEDIGVFAGFTKRF